MCYSIWYSHILINNGLRLFVIPKKGFQKTYVTYTTQFGSLDNTFKPHHKDQYVTVPDGVAHFLISCTKQITRTIKTCKCIDLSIIIGKSSK
jgi:hypothetical protein